jgi:GAF domain-containing protein
MESRELWLAAKLADLADAFETDESEDELGRRLIGLLTELLAPAEVGLLLSDGSDHLVTVSGGGRIAGLMSLQAQQQGSGADGHRIEKTILNETIGVTDARWPAFAAAARTAGLISVSAIPVRHRDQDIGLVCIFATAEHKVSETEFSLATTLTKTAAMAIALRRDARRSVVLAEQLQRALDSRVQIEQAKGAVAARLGVTPEAAFQLLRAYARRTNMSLTAVAAEVIRSELPAHVLVQEARTGLAGNGQRTPHSG